MEPKPPSNNLEKMKLGCILRSIQRENNEPENVALGQISKELRYLQRQSQYAQEIERVLKEMRLTVSLIGDCRTCPIPAGVNRQELLAYYQGIFLTLVHQMKDKVIQLVHLMTEQTIPNKPDKEDDVAVSDLLQKKLRIVTDLGIEAEVREWDQENTTSNIAVALRKRTAHHHRVTGLVYNMDFINLGFTDIASQPQMQGQLTDYGKKHIEKMRAESTESLFTGAATKAASTLHTVEQNVENVAKALIFHFKLPTSPQDVAEVIKQYGEMLVSLEVTNRCSYEKIPEPQKSMLNHLVTLMKEKYKDQVAAVYVVGSLPRGEYEEGYSDINIYFILNVDDEEGQAIREDFMFSVRVFTKKEFLSEECRKYRVIAKSDGILLYGDDIMKDEKLPKAGLLLALILSGDILVILNNAKKWIEGNPTASANDIAKKSRSLAKRLIDFLYSVAMSNKPQYSASRKERARYILEAFGNKKIIDTLMDVSRYGVGNKESFNNMIDGFQTKAEQNLKKMRDVKAQIENRTKHETTWKKNL